MSEGPKKKGILITVVAALLVLLLVGLLPLLLPVLLVALVTSIFASDPCSFVAAGVGVSSEVSQISSGFDEWSVVQVRHAATIVATGKGMKIPPRGWVIALATAMQESGLKNYANDNDAYPEVKARSMAIPHDAVGHDHDSVGLFQQRPVEGAGGWGTVAELMTPVVSARKFYEALQKVDGWQVMSVTYAAQKVQRSAYPNAYAKWEDKANRLAAHLTGVPAIEDIGGGPPGAECGAAERAPLSAQGWANPTVGDLGGGLGAPREGHLHAGVDIMAGLNTPIYAVAAGKVITHRCNSPSNGDKCDEPGNSRWKGCGWYVDIDHGNGIVTRYCHMVREPLVGGDGQKKTVEAGENIGFVGTSGGSSGPHLHFEVHTGVSSGEQLTYANAVDPIAFMALHGIQLGKQPVDSRM